MRTINDIRRITTEVADNSVKAVRDLPRFMLTAEQRLQRRVRTVVRVTLATSFIWLTTILSVGVQVTTAVAKSVSKDKSPTERRIQKPKRHKQHYKPLTESRVLEGTASWYGGRFHNRKTASGKKFDTHTMMAAHRSLPFGTLVRVTNLDNDKSCIVEIADRGPFVRDRIIDVSQAAAQELEFQGKGTARVRLQVISKDIANVKSKSQEPVFFADNLKAPSFQIGKSSVSTR